MGHGSCRTLGARKWRPLPCSLRNKRSDGKFPIHEDGQRGCLDTAHRKRVAVGETVSAAEVHAHQPVGAAAAPGRVRQGIVAGALTQFFEAIVDGLGGQRGDPKALDGFGALGRLVDVTKNQLTFSARVGRADHLIGSGVVEDFSDNFELVARAVDHL